MRVVSGSCPGVGRKRKWTEDMQARFEAGTFARIARVLGETEDRTDFVRRAVENELRRLERRSAKKRGRMPSAPRGKQQ